MLGEPRKELPSGSLEIAIYFRVPDNQQVIPCRDELFCSVDPPLTLCTDEKNNEDVSNHRSDLFNALH